MDPTSTVRTDTLPALATIFIPGALGSSGFLWFLVNHLPLDLEVSLNNQHEASRLAILSLIWIASGFVIESIGSYVEVYFIDRRRKDYKDMHDTWWKYLSLAWPNEPVGQRYIRRFLTGFKFELNMSVASMAAAMALLLLVFTGDLPFKFGVELVAGMIILSIGSFFAAKSSAGVLAMARAKLVDGVLGAHEKV